MAVFRRGSKWAVTVYVDGKKTWVGTFGDKLEAMNAHVSALRGGIEKVEGFTCGQFARLWTERYPRQRESTNITNRERLSKFITDFDTRPLASITRFEARTWALQNQSRVKVVAAMYADAVADKVVADNPFAGLRLKRSDGRRYLVVPTEQELGQLMECAQRVQGDWGEVVLAPFIMFAAHTGLRPGELYALRWEDVDTKAGTVRVEWQWNQVEGRRTPPKYDSRRTVPLIPAAADALERVARVRDEIFSAPRGGMLTGKNMGQYFPPTARAAGRPDFTPHCLRHYYGTLLANNGLLPYEIAQMLGHRDGGKLAMSLYIHVTERDARERVAARFQTPGYRDLRALEGGA